MTICENKNREKLKNETFVEFKYLEKTTIQYQKSWHGIKMVGWFCQIYFYEIVLSNPVLLYFNPYKKAISVYTTKYLDCQHFHLKQLVMGLPVKSLLLQMRISDYNNGAISEAYLMDKFQEATKALDEYAVSVAPAGWTCYWNGWVW